MFGVVTVLAEKKPKVSAVIPAYFEEKTIGSVVELCLPFVDEVIVVNDGSTDDTSMLAERTGALVIEMEKKHGSPDGDSSRIERGFREHLGYS